MKKRKYLAGLALLICVALVVAGTLMYVTNTTETALNQVVIAQTDIQLWEFTDDPDVTDSTDEGWVYDNEVGIDYGVRNSKQEAGDNYLILSKRPDLLIPQNIQIPGYVYAVVQFEVFQNDYGTFDKGANITEAWLTDYFAAGTGRTLEDLFTFGITGWTLLTDADGNAISVDGEFVLVYDPQVFPDALGDRAEATDPMFFFVNLVDDNDLNMYAGQVDDFIRSLTPGQLYNYFTSLGLSSWSDLITFGTTWANFVTEFVDAYQNGTTLPEMPASIAPEGFPVRSAMGLYDNITIEIHITGYFCDEKGRSEGFAQDYFDGLTLLTY